MSQKGLSMKSTSSCLLCFGSQGVVAQQLRLELSEGCEFESEEHQAATTEHFIEDLNSAKVMSPPPVWSLVVAVMCHDQSHLCTCLIPCVSFALFIPNLLLQFTSPASRPIL